MIRQLSAQSASANGLFGSLVPHQGNFTVLPICRKLTIRQAEDWERMEIGGAILVRKFSFRQRASLELPLLERKRRESI